MVIGVHQQLGALAMAGSEERAQAGHDVRVAEEHRRDQHQRRAAIHGAGQPLGETRGRICAHLDHLDPALICQAVELAPDGVELAVRRHEPRAPSQRQRREQARHQLVRVLAEGDDAL